MTEKVVKDVYTIQIPPHRRSDTLSPYCEACKNGVVHLSSLEVRKFTQTGKLPNVCKTCNKEFLKICRTQIRNMTERETLHSCETCGRSFIHAGNLKKHKLLHGEPSSNGEPPRASTSKGEEAVAEEEEVNGKEVPEPLESAAATSTSVYVGFENRPCICKDCGKDFSNEYAFIKHCQFHCVNEMNTCCTCNQLFENVGEHKNHNLSHEEKSEYVCNICPITYIKISELKKHCLSNHEKIYQQQGKQIKSEPEKEMLSCNLCSKTFIRRNAFLKHCEQHASEAPSPSPFTCQTCSKMFTSEQRLNIHQLLHKKGHVNPRDKKCFACKVCGKGFKLRNAYMRHRLVHK